MLRFGAFSNASDCYYFSAACTQILQLMIRKAKIHRIFSRGMLLDGQTTNIGIALLYQECAFFMKGSSAKNEMK
jgi:hypothetical protein